jgi:RDD family protein
MAEPTLTGNVHDHVELAGHVQRVLAVFVDALILAGLGIGFVFVATSFIAAINNGFGFLLWVGSFTLLDLVMTAFLGLSLGRYATGVRVIRVFDGRAPGLVGGLVRIVVVMVTGWFAWATLGGGKSGPFKGLPARFWWDRAAQTVIVHSRGWKVRPVAEDDLRLLQETLRVTTQAPPTP